MEGLCGQDRAGQLDAEEESTLQPVWVQSGDRETDEGARVG